MRLMARPDRPTVLLATLLVVAASAAAVRPAFSQDAERPAAPAAPRVAPVASETAAPAAPLAGERGAPANSALGDFIDAVLNATRASGETVDKTPADTGPSTAGEIRPGTLTDTPTAADQPAPASSTTDQTLPAAAAAAAVTPAAAPTPASTASVVKPARSHPVPVAGFAARDEPRIAPTPVVEISPTPSGPPISWEGVLMAVGLLLFLGLVAGVGIILFTVSVTPRLETWTEMTVSLRKGLSGPLIGLKAWVEPGKARFEATRRFIVHTGGG